MTQKKPKRFAQRLRKIIKAFASGEVLIGAIVIVIALVIVMIILLRS